MRPAPRPAAVARDAAQPVAPAQWVHEFAALRMLGLRERSTLDQAAALVSFADGELIFEAGRVPRHYVLIRSGSVRVYQLSPEGREIFLYRLAGGDTCVMTASAVRCRVPYAAYAVAEGVVAAVVLDAEAFDALVAGSAAFRRFVLAEHATQFGKLVALLNEWVGSRIEVRLARALVRLAGSEPRVVVTHAALATEIGSAREVVSRSLKDLEARGLVERRRGAVLIRNLARLSRMSEPTAQR